MSAGTCSESSRKMPTGSSRRKARVPLHITRQAIVEDVPAMDMEDEDEEPPFFGPDTPSTSSDRRCNGTQNDGESPKMETSEKEEPELPEGTVVVQPEAAPDDDSDFDGPEFKSKRRSRRKMHKDVISDISRVHCTSCSRQVNHLDARSFKPHPALKVVICWKCFEYYESGKFTQDEDGIDEQCRWCAEGGSLICCDFCSNAFCKQCIKRNLGRSTLSTLLGNDDTKWRCYVCDPSPLQPLQKTCRDIVRGIALKQAAVGKPRRHLLKDGAASTETSEVEENADFLHPSISKVSVSLKIKPSNPSLEITPEGLRVIRPPAGDRQGLKVALWVMRSLRQNSERAEREIKKRLAAMSGNNEAVKSSGDGVQSDENKKWLVMKIGSKRPLPQHNGQTSHVSKPKVDVVVNQESAKESMKDEALVLHVGLTGKVSLDSPAPKTDSKSKNAEKEDNQQSHSFETGASSVDTKTELPGNDKSKGSRSSSRIKKDKYKEDEEAMAVDKEDQQSRGGDSSKESKEKDPRYVDNDNKGKDIQERSKIDQEEEDAKEVKEEVTEDAKERCDQDIECEKALMDEIRGMVSDFSEEENATPKKEKPERKHGLSITPLRIKLERISPIKMEQAQKEGCKSPRRQKTTPKTSRSNSQKHSSDSSEEDADARTSLPKGKKVSKELFDPNDDSGNSSSSDTSSSSSSSSSSKDSEWKMAPRRSLRRREKDGSDDKERDNKKEQKKKRKEEKDKKRKKKTDPKESDTEIDFPKASNHKKKAVTENKRGPGRDSSNLEDDSDEVERLLTPRKANSSSPGRSTRLKLTPKSSSKSKAKSKSKVRESDSSNFDSDLERQIKSLSKAPKKTKKDQDEDEDEGEDSCPEKSDSVEEAEPKKEKGKAKSKTNSKKSKKAKEDLDSTSDSDDEASGNEEGQSGDDVQQLGTASDGGSALEAGTGKQGGADEALDSDLENKLAEQQLMEEIEAELDKDNRDSDEDDSSDDSSESDKPKKTKGRKKKTAKDDDDFKEKSNEEEDDEDEDESDDFDSSSDEEKPSRKKKQGRRHRLMRVKLGETSSSNDEDTDASGSDSKKKSKSKRGRKRGRVSRSSSDSDSIRGKPKTASKRGRRKRSSSGSDHSSNDFQKERSYNRGKGKGKKRRRIKVATDSDSDVQAAKGSGSSDAEKDTPSKHGRKKIRKLISKNKLQEETVRAAKEEKERRKRIADKRKMVTAISEEAAESMGTVDEIILERDSKSKEPILSVLESLAKQLKPHQVEGVQFMWDCTFESMEKLKEKGSGCILAHCMGLGKTLQVIAFLHTVMTNEDISLKHCLVVAPLNTVLNWVAEFEKWLGEDSEIEVFEITTYKNNWQRADALQYWHQNGGVMVMGYSMYRQLSMHKFVKNKKQRAIFTQTLVDPGPEIVICDEGHMLKNDASAISKALNSIRTRRRICLTGTPLQNNLIEYHCMVDFVKPNLLGTRKEFLNRFVNPITNGQCADSTQRDVRIMKRRAHVLHEMLSGCVQRKDYSALTKFLPPKHEYVISVRLSPVQIKLYEQYLASQSRNDSGELIEGSSKGSGTGLFADYQQLMQIWTHPHVLKLSEIRQEKVQNRNYMSDFVTSASESEVSDSNDSIQQFVVEGSEPEEIDDEDEPSTSTATRGTRRTRGMMQQQRAVKEEKDGDRPERKKPDKGDRDSDSSLEIIKTWKTRSRCRDPDDENVTRSPSPATAKPKWYDEFIQEGDDTKIELSGKLVLLFEVLKHAESIGEKVLVFSQSLLSLDLIEDMLQTLEERAQIERDEGSQDLNNQIGGVGSWVKGEDYFRMDGSTSAAFRKAWAQTFNDMNNYRARLFLISTKAGSLGTNLIGANRVIIFDASWNPSHDIQSIFRVYRFGQTRAVYIYRFVAQGTMEEKIYERQVTKQSLSCRVVDEHQIERHFTSTDLSELYTFTPERLDDPNRPERETPVLPKDYVLAEMLKHNDKWIVKYHEHDSLLENIESEELTEEERKNAWKEYEDEKEGRIRMGFDPRLLANQGMNQQDLAKIQQMWYSGINPGIYSSQNSLQSAQLLSNPQRPVYSVLPNMIPGSGFNPSSVMQQLAMTAASTGNYPEFRQIVMYQRQMQQQQEQLKLQQAYQKQQQQQQQQQFARMSAGRNITELYPQQLLKAPSTASKYSGTTRAPDLQDKILQNLSMVAKVSQQQQQQQQPGGGAWSGGGGGKTGPSGPGASTSGTQ